ncbi:hypothetical protein GUJ93_ZPchr0008g11970 [Zizania palustris]|uniref:Uncharacterized protein n=1 Tax=Zizania palustris TaxID=103762 RepID=A0A8J5REN5_ZIZPA|nr:hypothetical protein GUJ93_ZPchr0008g11970 [Zizania palustris]
MEFLEHTTLHSAKGGACGRVAETSGWGYQDLEEGIGRGESVDHFLPGESFTSIIETLREGRQQMFVFQDRKNLPFLYLEPPAMLFFFMTFKFQLEICAPIQGNHLWHLARC